MCLTFALKNYTSTPAPDKIRIANELEQAIDAAYSEEDYRHRIYRIGGYLSVIPSFLSSLAFDIPRLARPAHEEVQSLTQYNNRKTHYSSKVS